MIFLILNIFLKPRYIASFQRLNTDSFQLKIFTTILRYQICIKEYFIYSYLGFRNESNTQ
ncbi:hypothetical protein QE422_003737 [Chryseobacterium sp. SORGH_AS 447]|nr:hypothetical protein [Chryseobacterium sp. SORGH_AS_0447]